MSMTGATVVLAINLIVVSLLSASFATIWLHDRGQVIARWMVGVYGLGAIYFMLEFAVARLGEPPLLVTLCFATLLGALTLFDVGVARKYGVPVPRRALTAIFMFSVAACWFVNDLPRSSFTRTMVYQIPFFMVQAIGAGILWRVRSRSRLDTALMWLLALSALHFLSKPFLPRLLGDGVTQTYLSMNYAMISQAMGTIFSVASALLFLVILARDVIADVRMLSETDALSRLLNRGGFEQHAGALLQEADAKGRPMALVICDLDHFKAINDTFGHASGDMVIRAFGAFLREASAQHVVGRIGGEEFAILLPGANLAAARLFAEAVRAAFSSLPVEGLPERLRCTASFGVAERMPGEMLSDLLSRADKALYEAKRDGRDCVRATADLRALSGGMLPGVRGYQPARG